MREGPRFVAVIDIGKTNAKVVLHDLGERHDVNVRSMPNVVRQDGPYPHFDTDALFDFILDGLAAFTSAHPIDAISITTHGASITLVGESDLALPVLDYEAELTNAEGYEDVRPPFNETFSPPMANGLNVGRQLYWLQHHFPEEFAEVRHILTYPQYWAYRLTGETACEATSLGCHTDLWAPERRDFSSLVDRMGWRDRFAPLRRPFDVIGRLKPEWAERIGVGERSIPVFCGLHDSNASLLPHLQSQRAPFAVVSTGTWVVSFSIGGHAASLDASRNMLAYVDAFGRPVPSTLFMGGREFDLLTGRVPAEPSEAAIGRIVDGGVMVWPAIARGTGPFPNADGGWSVSETELSSEERTAAASLYVALMTSESLQLIGADGPVVVEGPFARNALFLRALGLLVGRPIFAPTHGTGTSAGAALLALGPGDPQTGGPSEAAVPAAPIPGLAAYAARWREHVRERRSGR